MEAGQLQLARALSRCSLSSPGRPAVMQIGVPAVARRHKSTTARTKRALRVPPHESFADRPSGVAASNTIVFNPPA